MVDVGCSVLVHFAATGGAKVRETQAVYLIAASSLKISIESIASVVSGGSGGPCLLSE